MKLILIGSTGLVGQEVLSLALKDERINHITALTRRQLIINNPKLDNIIVKFDNLPTEASFWQSDAVICTLGTTIKKAGSQVAFRQVDYTYPLQVAKIAKQYQTPTFALNSALGANVDSRFFYNRIKGELEASLKKLQFKSLALIRPGLIKGKRKELRLKEQFSILLLTIFSPILPKKYRPNPASLIAKALLEAACQAKPGEQIITSEYLN